MPKNELNFEKVVKIAQRWGWPLTAGDSSPRSPYTLSLLQLTILVRISVNIIESYRITLEPNTLGRHSALN